MIVAALRRGTEPGLQAVWRLFLALPLDARRLAAWARVVRYRSTRGVSLLERSFGALPLGSRRRGEVARSEAEW